MASDDQNIWHYEGGAVLIEFTLVMMTFLLILFGIVEFSYLFYQWNAATKAVQHGARLAAVSDPVASDLKTLTGMEGGQLPGAEMPNFTRVCTSSNASGSAGSCTNGTYDAVAMQTLVFGRGRTACAAPLTGRDLGMCNYFNRITPRNVRITYHNPGGNTGMGYAGRPGGPVPTITVELRDLVFSYVMLNGLVPGLSSTTLPGFHTTMTGEDLRISGS